jgi:stage V sporulation protein AB
MFFKYTFLWILGLSFGATVSAGVFAFITMLNVIPRLVHRTGTAMHIYGYENAIILGGALGNAVLLFVRYLPVGRVGMAVFGVCAGVFVGCLAMALAESLRVFPVFVQRLNLRRGLPIILVALALGKCIGTLLQYFA